MDIAKIMHERQSRNISGGFPYVEYQIDVYSEMCTAVLEIVVNSPNRDVKD
jgi:hypothetical protein